MMQSPNMGDFLNLDYKDDSDTRRDNFGISSDGLPTPDALQDSSVNPFAPGYDGWVAEEVQPFCNLEPTSPPSSDTPNGHQLTESLETLARRFSAIEETAQSMLRRCASHGSAPALASGRKVSIGKGRNGTAQGESHRRSSSLAHMPNSAFLTSINEALAVDGTPPYSQNPHFSVDFPHNQYTNPRSSMSSVESTDETIGFAMEDWNQLLSNKRFSLPEQHQLYTPSYRGYGSTASVISDDGASSLASGSYRASAMFYPHGMRSELEHVVQNGPPLGMFLTTPDNASLSPTDEDIQSHASLSGSYFPAQFHEHRPILSPYGLHSNGEMRFADFAARSDTWGETPDGNALIDPNQIHGRGIQRDDMHPAYHHAPYLNGGMLGNDRGISASGTMSEHELGMLGHEQDAGHPSMSEFPEMSQHPDPIFYHGGLEDRHPTAEAYPKATSSSHIIAPTPVYAGQSVMDATGFLLSHPMPMDSPHGGDFAHTAYGYGPDSSSIPRSASVFTPTPQQPRTIVPFSQGQCHATFLPQLSIEPPSSLKMPGGMLSAPAHFLRHRHSSPYPGVSAPYPVMSGTPPASSSNRATPYPRSKPLSRGRTRSVPALHTQDVGTPPLSHVHPQSQQQLHRSRKNTLRGRSTGTLAQTDPDAGMEPFSLAETDMGDFKADGDQENHMQPLSERSDDPSGPTEIGVHPHGRRKNTRHLHSALARPASSNAKIGENYATGSMHPARGSIPRSVRRSNTPLSSASFAQYDGANVERTGTVKMHDLIREHQVMMAEVAKAQATRQKEDAEAGQMMETLNRLMGIQQI
ncbi:uncharacterized protein EV422DRAFT_616406 [Fimicolochytrium jonesii]|uniref:uncharacterized protein n=1 Tax=Fimicolochytrium jonesii TaxID=1396493 RepID=UPI0022FDCCD5|nr:uncharacterized protein EV422DRAFT_616406 [Fimicolochytrium jonesii]KAI8827013.1 hypothetical protein EV422DRAFT_616406 [Fimicolochytrium jonesii]